MADLAPRTLSPAELEQRQKAAIKHGLSVKTPAGRALADRSTRRLAAHMRRILPWLEPGDMPALKAWCQLETQSNRLYAHLRGLPPVNEEGEPWRALSELRMLKLAQLQYERELGMTPAARAQLGLDVKRAGVADVAAEFARLRLEREREQAGGQVVTPAAAVETSAPPPADAEPGGAA